ncbi:MAG: glutaminase A [Lawsonibacter sp.]|nr:glutaminase A [Lawsonibacter sp.]
MEELLEELLEECRPYTQQGNVATYIPELAKGDPNDLGIYVLRSDGRHYQAGDYKKCFTIQSVVKPILLLLALLDNGEEYVRARVGVEATGKPFDAINVTDQTLLSEHLNPMVNMGAIAMCTLIKGSDYNERFQRLLELTRTLAGNPNIGINEDVFLSEKRTGNKNRALAFLLKNYNIIQDDVEDVLDCYFKACSISVNSKDLANIGFTLASRGKHPQTDERLYPSQYAHYVNAILTTCGMYDGSGEFAVNVGVPAKSGVGGGIMAVVPTRMGIGIFSPGLDAKGNSLAGIQVLQRLAKRMYLSIF